jgi:hypothetical protein
MVFHLIFLQLQGTPGARHFGVDFFKVVVYFRPRHRLLAMLTQHQVSAAVDFMHGEVGCRDVLLAVKKKRRKNKLLDIDQ